MKSLAQLSLAVLAVVVALSGRAVADQSQDELRKLRGTWDPVVEVVDGQPVPEPLIRDVSLVVDGDRWMLRSTRRAGQRQGGRHLCDRQREALGVPGDRFPPASDVG